MEQLPRPTLETIRAELGPAFANDEQRQFLDSTAPEVLYSGAFGAGKSRIGCEKVYALAQQWPGAPFGIFRKVAASLPATTKITFERDVCPKSAIRRANKSEGWIELNNGSRIWFMGLDPDPLTKVPSKVGSLDLAFAFVDEAVELEEADWIMLKGRLRYPGVPYHQLAAATNPGPPTHWLIERFVPPQDGHLLLHASTLDNRLSPQDYRDEMARMPPGLMRQRYVEGRWVGDTKDALWKAADIRYRIFPRILRGGVEDPDLVRVVVGVDPAVTSNIGSDETGIIVAGLGSDGDGYVMDDRSCRATPNVWAQRAVSAYHEYKADCIVVEVNNGGDMVPLVIRQIDPTVPVRSVHASRGKFTRAEPIANLYRERPVDETPRLARVWHIRSFPELEMQQTTWNPKTGDRSPDRLDALVWALTDLMLGSTTSGDFSLVA